MAALTNKATLVNLSIKGPGYGASKQDKKVSAEVAEQHGAEKDSGRYTKSLVPKEYREPLAKVEREARKDFQRLTLLWEPDWNILPNAAYWEFMEVARKHNDAMQVAAGQLRDRWDEVVADAERRLGSLYNAGDFKDPGKVFALDGRTGDFLRFFVQVRSRPVPIADDFRADLGDDEIQRQREALKRDMQEQITQALDDLWGRLRTPIETLRDRLETYDEAERKLMLPVWIDNVRNVSETLPKLNLTGDPKLTAICKQVQTDLTDLTANGFKIGDVDAEVLKKSPAVRASIRQKADAILDQMSLYTGGADLAKEAA